MLIEENRWRAQRYGHGRGPGRLSAGPPIVPCADLIDELIDLIREDAEAMGCLECRAPKSRTIVEHGTSADRQRAAYARAVDGGADHEAALAAVVDQLMAETVRGI